MLFNRLPADFRITVAIFSRLETGVPGVVYPESNKYHLIVRGLFKNFKASFIIFKLLASLKYYERSFKILK